AIFSQEHFWRSDNVALHSEASLCHALSGRTSNDLFGALVTHDGWNRPLLVIEKTDCATSTHGGEQTIGRTEVESDDTHLAASPPIDDISCVRLSITRSA